MNSFYVAIGSPTASFQVPIGTVVNDVEVDGVPIAYTEAGNVIMIDISGTLEGAHLVAALTPSTPFEAVMCIYDGSVFFQVTNGHLFAKIIRTDVAISFNESISKSKLFVPAQVGKTVWGIPLQRMGFDTVPFVPVSQMISLGTFAAMEFDPLLSARLKYTVPVPFDPERNTVRLWRYLAGAWTELPHTDATNRYLEFTPEPPGVYVAAIPKPPGFVPEDMRRVHSMTIPQRHPGQARYGIR